MKERSAQPRVVESLVEPQRQLGEFEGLRKVAIDRHERQRMHGIGVAGLLGLTVSQREVHGLQRHQRKQLRPAVVCAGGGIDEQIDDRPYLGGIRHRRIEQLTDAAPTQVGADGLKLRVHGCPDLVVRFGKGDPEQLQRFERNNDAVVVAAAGLIDLDAQAIDPRAIEIGPGLAQHQVEQLVCRLKMAHQVFTLGETQIQLERLAVAPRPRICRNKRRGSCQIVARSAIGDPRFRFHAGDDVQSEQVDDGEDLLGRRLGSGGHAELASDAQVRCGSQRRGNQRIRGLLDAVVRESVRRSEANHQARLRSVAER